jgi:hypothetical protein
MSRLDIAKQRLREHAEHHLRVAAMEELRSRYPASTVAPYRERGGLLWRYAFVPLYRRVPWQVKERAMHALRMTAEGSGWTPPPRRPAEPWRPPAQTGTDASSRSSR